MMSAAPLSMTLIASAGLLTLSSAMTRAWTARRTRAIPLRSAALTGCSTIATSYGSIL